LFNISSPTLQTAQTDTNSAKRQSAGHVTLQSAKLFLSAESNKEDEKKSKSSKDLQDYSRHEKH